MNCFVCWYCCKHIFGKEKKNCTSLIFSGEGKKQHSKLSSTSFSAQLEARTLLIVKRMKEASEKGGKVQWNQNKINFHLFQVVTKSTSIQFKQPPTNFYWRFLVRLLNSRVYFKGVEQQKTTNLEE